MGDGAIGLAAQEVGEVGVDIRAHMIDMRAAAATGIRGRIATGAAIQRVVARAPGELIVARQAIDHIVAGTAGKVVAGGAEDLGANLFIAGHPAHHEATVGEAGDMRIGLPAFGRIADPPNEPRSATCAARRAKPSPLADKRQQFVVAALPAAQPQEAVRQDAALQERVELVLDEARQLTAGAGLVAGDEVGRVPDADRPLT